MLKNVKERPLIHLRTSDYVSVWKYLKLYSMQKKIKYISINSNKIDYKNRHNWPTLFNNYDVSTMGPYQVINNLHRLAVAPSWHCATSSEDKDQKL